MYHPLYYQATRCTGQTVFLHHVSGRIYHGTVVSVAPHGLYVMQHPPRTRLAEFSVSESGESTVLLRARVAHSGHADRTDCSVVGGYDEKHTFSRDSVVAGTSALNSLPAEASVELAYSPVAFFAFGALTGLTLGVVASRLWW